MSRKTGATIRRSADKTSSLSLDAEFVLVIAACLVVHVAVIALILNTLDPVHPLFFIAAVQAGVVVLARHIGRMLHAASRQLSSVPPAPESTTA